MYAEVIVDIIHQDVDRVFTYLVPAELNVQVGMHVCIPFGRGDHPKDGYVIGLKDTADSGIAYKTILRSFESYPVFTSEQLALAEWIKSGYNCTLAEALRLMIPARMRGGRIHEKVIRTVKTVPDLDLDEALRSLCTKSGKPKAQKQYEVLKLLGESGVTFAVTDLNDLIPGASAAISALSERGYVLVEGADVFRRPAVSKMPDNSSPPLLSPSQQEAVSSVCSALGEHTHEVFLLHGVTGSGKTEVYLSCIAACLEQGRQAIMLIPEISLTPQNVHRFRARFGDRIAVLHSGLSAGERFDEWRRIRFGLADVVIGARSAVFAPVQRLGLIIIDEEHENSYISEISPRYNAIEVASYRCRSASVPLLLGSATPSLLSYYRACSGRYRLLTMPERIMKRPLPEVEVIDMREEFLQGNNGIYSKRLLSLLTECLENGKQAMLFLNRRGYSTFISCRACGTVVQCPNCDISMTYHKGENRLRCHYCGASAPLPERCPACQKPFMKHFGIGTEQVEEQFRSFFPDVPMLRMDTDTLHGKNSISEMLSDFAAGRAKVLIGTQMIAKGHDFPNVTLVGVIAADSTLCIPDYRSTERTFQLLTQVSGRAGRDDAPGKVVIQTYKPEHPAITYARHHDYPGFFRYELSQRRGAVFPPYSMFIRLLFSGTDDQTLYASGEEYARRLDSAIREVLGEDGLQELLLLSASPAPIKKKQGNYRYQILIKLLRSKRTGEVLRCIYAYVDEHRSELFAALEINPQDMF